MDRLIYMGTHNLSRWFSGGSRRPSRPNVSYEQGTPVYSVSYERGTPVYSEPGSMVLWW